MALWSTCQDSFSREWSKLRIRRKIFLLILTCMLNVDAKAVGSCKFFEGMTSASSFVEFHHRIKLLLSIEKSFTYFICGCDQTPLKFMQRHKTTKIDVIEDILHHLKHQPHKERVIFLISIRFFSLFFQFMAKYRMKRLKTHSIPKNISHSILYTLSESQVNDWSSRKHSE